MSSKLSISMYHYIRDLKNSRYPGIKGLDYRLFKQQLEFFQHNFNVVTMEEVISAVTESYELPDNALLLTFDDGYIDHYLYALPALKEYKMQGSFFVPGIVFTEHTLLDVNKLHFVLAVADEKCLLRDLLEKLDHYRGQEFDYPSNDELYAEYATANRFDCKEVMFIKKLLQAVLPEKLRSIISSELFKTYIGINEEVFAREIYLNHDQMELMKKNGMFFGVHGYNHYWMNKLESSALKQDIQKALECMDGLINPKRWVVNYPYGSYSDNVIEYVKSTGGILGLVTEVGIADLSFCDPLRLPRFDTNDFPPKSSNYVKYSTANP